MANMATIKKFGLQSGTDRTVYAEWAWTKSNTEHFQIRWWYATENEGVAFLGSETTTTIARATYTAPENATRVWFHVKPISKKRTVNNKETSYWAARWSTQVTYYFKNNPPSKPAAPTVTIDKLNLTAKLENLDINADYVCFQVVANDSEVYSTGTVEIKTNSASMVCVVPNGNEYKVRCRGARGTLLKRYDLSKEYGSPNDLKFPIVKESVTIMDAIYGEWSDYSSNVGTIPSVPSGITTCKAISETAVYLEWSSTSIADTYDIEYTTKKEYFDGSDQTTIISDITTTQYRKTGLETGQEYFFRLRAVNEKGSSGWTDPVSIVIGKEPVAPTTWSSTTTAIAGESLTLYWVHNAEDGSSETYAEIELYVDGVKETHTLKKSTEEDEKDKTSSFAIDTSKYIEGIKIQWRVRTSGITKVYGDWSVQRTVDIYAHPTLKLSVTDVNGDILETLTAFPFYVSGLAGPNTQAPIGYHLEIMANKSYETLDQIGNRQTVKAGDSVYSKYFDTNDPLLVELSASNVDLENNVSYTVTCTVSMNSGLTTNASVDFTVAWSNLKYEPNAEIGIDMSNYSASIRPYCEDENGVLISDVILAVYRREFDGGFVELATNLSNIGSTFITDPHPALDYARYRIVAISKTTGTVSYYDLPGYPIGITSIIIQWDEDWSYLDVTNEDLLEQPAWSGSLLKLPYNIDVSDKHKPDVVLVNYIGRAHPVSYYGTQVGATSTWNVEIEKSDKETLYGLRRLALWMGDVYVREPSGSGYWANITVSFSQKHCELTIPVTIEIVRVEGGE